MIRFAPDLAVEVISPSNTPEEMKRKLQDYFDAGVRLVWYVYPDPPEVHVFRSPEQPVVLRPTDTLSGEDLLPGFQIEVKRIFAEPSGSGGGAK
jgi:Uma2 family endonuclease